MTDNLDPATLRVFNPAFHAEGDHPSLTGEPELMTEVLAMLGPGWTPELVIEEYPHVIVFAVDPAFAEHGVTPSGIGTCGDCGASGVEVVEVPDFDTRTGDELPPLPVCVVCWPLRCGPCPVCEGPDGERLRAAAVAAQVAAGTLPPHEHAGRVRESDDGHTFVGACSCGWTGPERTAGTASRSDDVHAQAEADAMTDLDRHHHAAVEQWVTR